MKTNVYRGDVSTPFVQPLTWREPLQALAALGDQEGVLAFIGEGKHPTARWSYILHHPVRIHQWSEGSEAGPFDGLMDDLNLAQIALRPEYGPFQGGWAGLLGYELGRAFEKVQWPTGDGRRPKDGLWPDVWLGLYDTLGVFDAHSQRCFALSWGLNEDGQRDAVIAQERAMALANAINAKPPNIATPKGQGLSPTRPRDAAQTAIARAVEYIHAGDIFQANISIGFSGHLGANDTPLALFERLVARHPSPFATFLNLGDLAVVSHSPERFLSRTPQGQLETRPIKGTAPRHPDPAIDAANAAMLQASAKDRAENLMIVDLMRNDLARVCVAGSVKVPRLCALESFSTVHHLVSDVIGQQKPDQSFFDALRASFPPGSITGAPKVRAMEIIAELEGEARGPWCGSMIRVGFDGAADSSVLIRTAACEKRSDGWAITARGGAGIVADSDSSLEYEEMLVKVRALRVAAAHEDGQ